jgi:hypothetical protein
MGSYTTHEPQWETTEYGWHAVAALCSTGYQWTAYIEYADAPHWRIWAGCMFESLQQAQEWCRTEIAHQIRRSEVAQVAEVSTADCWSEQPEAWNWLWATLNAEVGEARAAEIREELARRLREGK